MHLINCRHLALTRIQVMIRLTSIDETKAIAFKMSAAFSLLTG
jgi:hypothetical protein